MDKEVAEAGFTVAKEWFALLGVVIGFSLNLIRDEVIKRKKLKKDCYFLSVLISAHLEKFIDEAIKYINEDLVYMFDGELPEHKVKKPEFNVVGVDVNWLSIEQQIMRDILWLSQDIEKADSVIGNVAKRGAEAPFYEDVTDVTRYEYAILAIKADKLCRELSNATGTQRKNNADTAIKLKELNDLVCDTKRTRFEKSRALI